MDKKTVRTESGGHRWKLLFLAAIFFVPLGISFYWYYGLDSVRPAASVQKGELILPARPLPQLQLPRAHGDTTSADFLERTWTLVYLAEGPCDSRCRDRMAELRQLRLALGRDRNRVGGVLLYSGEPPELEWLTREHAGLIAASVDNAEARTHLLPQFGTEQDMPEALFRAERVYIVDPNGNLMMRYDAGTALKDIHEDLKRLLRLSRIG